MTSKAFINIFSLDNTTVVDCERNFTLKVVCLLKNPFILNRNAFDLINRLKYSKLFMSALFCHKIVENLINIHFLKRTCLFDLFSFEW